MTREELDAIKRRWADAYTGPDGGPSGCNTCGADLQHHDVPRLIAAVEAALEDAEWAGGVPTPADWAAYSEIAPFLRGPRPKSAGGPR